MVRFSPGASVNEPGSLNWNWLGFAPVSFTLATAMAARVAFSTVTLLGPPIAPAAIEPKSIAGGESVGASSATAAGARRTRTVTRTVTTSEMRAARGRIGAIVQEPSRQAQGPHEGESAPALKSRAHRPTRRFLRPLAGT